MAAATMMRIQIKPPRLADNVGTLQMIPGGKDAWSALLSSATCTRHSVPMMVGCAEIADACGANRNCFTGNANHDGEPDSRALLSCGRRTPAVLPAGA